VEADNSRQIYAESGGRLKRIVATPGRAVRAGDVLAQLEDPELPLKIKRGQAQVEEAENQINGVTEDSRVELEAAHTQYDFARAQLQELRDEGARLSIRAPVDGIWVAPQLSDQYGAWLPRGAILGEVIPQRGFHFLAVVEQEAAANLFSGQLRGAQVRLRGQSGQAITTRDLRIIPAQQWILPSAALGWAAGGDIQTDNKDTNGLRTQVPFFLVYASLPPSPGVFLAQRRTGEIRFSTEWEPLLTQGLRRMRQLFQERIK
jgi:putative peptide zinc metalloprotease protein